jgi:hypothetical protein
MTKGGLVAPTDGRESSEDLKYRSLTVPKYLIERNMPGAGKFSREERRKIAQKSVGVLRNLGPQIQWQHSYVTGDVVYSIYVAPNEEMIREHAKRGEFPANRISEIKTTIDPTTAE